MLPHLLQLNLFVSHVYVSNVRLSVLVDHDTLSRFWQETHITISLIFESCDLICFMCHVRDRGNELHPQDFGEIKNLATTCQVDLL